MASHPAPRESHPFPVISTSRLELRPIEFADLGAIVALHAESRVSRQLIDGVPDTPGKALVFLNWNRPMQRKGYGTFAVRRRGELQMIGLFSLTPFKENEELLELGGKLRPSAWRGGLALEAGAALIEHAFTNLARDRLISAFHPDNRPVPAALARLGFVPGTLTELFGSAVATMTLAHADWQKQGRAPRRPDRVSASLYDYGGAAPGQPYAMEDGAGTRCLEQGILGDGRR